MPQARANHSSIPPPRPFPAAHLSRYDVLPLQERAGKERNEATQGPYCACRVGSGGIRTGRARAISERIIKIISPAPPGGGTDIAARFVQPGLQEVLKQ